MKPKKYALNKKLVLPSSKPGSTLSKSKDRKVVVYLQRSIYYGLHLRHKIGQVTYCLSALSIGEKWNVDFRLFSKLQIAISLKLSAWTV